MKEMFHYEFSQAMILINIFIFALQKCNEEEDYKFIFSFWWYDNWGSFALTNIIQVKII